MAYGDFKYQLSVRLSILKLRQEGTDESPYWNRNTNEQLTVEETLDLGALDFIGVMRVLADLHQSLSDIQSRQIT